MNATPAVIAGAAVLAAGLATAGAVTAPGEVEMKDFAVTEPLTDTPGDPAMGRDWAAARKLGNCLACHENADMADLPFHGEVGPPLDGAGSRWNEAQLRAIVINSKVIFGEQTIMPAFYRTAGFSRPMDKFEGETILTAQQVEDVVAYLKTLKDE